MRSTVYQTIAKKIIRKIALSAKKKTIKQILSGRCRTDGLPENGRFTLKEIEKIIFQTSLNINKLMPYLNDLENLGNYQNEFVA